MSESTLVVVPSAETKVGVGKDDTLFVIEDRLSQVSTDEYDEIYGQLRHATTNDVLDVPLYDLLWPRLAVPFNGFPDNASSLNELIVLYRLLDDLPNLDSIGRIECVGVDKRFQALVEDFAANNGIETDTDTAAQKHRVAGLLRGIASFTLSILDTVLSLFFGLFVSCNRSKAATIFVPHLNRFGATKPVIEAADYDYQVVAPVGVVEWWYHRIRGNWEEASSAGTRPVGYWADTAVVWKQVRFLLAFVRYELLGRGFERDVRDVVASTTGVQLHRSVAWCLGNTYPANVGAIQNLWLADALYRRSGAKQVVVGSLSLRQQSFLFAAERCGVSSFHVPHTIPTKYDSVPKTDTTHFVPGENAVTFHEQSDHLAQEAKTVRPVGRPLLNRLAKDRSLSEPTEPVTVLIGTQPFDDDIRSQFVRDIIETLGGAEVEVEFVVKIHPVEDASFYRETLGDTDESVRITAADLHAKIVESDLTFVVNSNVGAESIALGTPVVSYNRWEPFVNGRPYIESTPVPLMETRNDLESFAAQLTEESIASLRDRELAFFDQYYIRDDDTADEIAEIVGSGG